MITPAFSLTATERVLPRLALDFTLGSLDPRVTFTRSGNTATVVNSTGVIVGVNANLPRFDYNPVTLASNGLLIEESRQNLFSYSQEFNNGYWYKANGAVSANGINGPDGNLTADSFAADATNQVHWLARLNVVPAASGTTYTHSVYAKANGYTKVRMSDTNLGRYAASFDLSAVTVTDTAGAGYVSASITPFNNGWYRCSITFTSTASNFWPALVGYPDTGATLNSYGASFLGNGTSGVYIWGAQLEAGAFATSYIPTTSAALTRNADVATMTGTNFSDWFNASEGTFVATVIPSIASNTTMGVLSTSDGTNTKTMDIRFQNGRSYGASVDTTVQALIDTGSFSQDVATTIGFAYKINSYVAAKNGASPVVDNLGTVPSQNTMRIGNLTAVSQFYGRQHIQQIMYYPQRCINAEVQAFSK